MMKTILQTEIPKETRGILYLCEFKNHWLTVKQELFFNTAYEALEAYAEIPNPESQLITGKDYASLITSLKVLHDNLKNEEWLRNLKNQI